MYHHKHLQTGRGDVWQQEHLLFKENFKNFKQLQQLLLRHNNKDRAIMTPSPIHPPRVNFLKIEVFGNHMCKFKQVGILKLKMFRFF